MEPCAGPESSAPSWSRGLLAKPHAVSRRGAATATAMTGAGVPRGVSAAGEVRVGRGAQTEEVSVVGNRMARLVRYVKGRQMC